MVVVIAPIRIHRNHTTDLHLLVLLTSQAMRRHQMLMGSLGMFTMGIMCQLYSIFNPDEEPFVQQMAFMFVAMPSALAIIHHYYYHHPLPLETNEERIDNQADTASPHTPQTRHHISTTANSTLSNGVVADTSQRRQPSEPTTTTKATAVG